MTAPADYMTHPTIEDAEWEEFVRAIPRDPTFTERVIDRMRQQLPSYASLSPEEMIAIGVPYWAALDEEMRAFADPATYEHFYAAGQIRARQGIPASDMLQSYRIYHQEVRRRAAELLDGRRNREALLLRIFEASAAYVDAAIVVTAEGHRAAELEMKRRALHHRANLVRQILFGGVSSSDLRNDLEAHGIDLSRQFHAVRARPRAGADLGALERFLQSAGDRQHRNGLVALIDNDVCGFISSLPDATPHDIVAVSGPVSALELPAAFALASRTLSTAIALRLAPGVYDLMSVGINAAVMADHDVGEIMVERYVRSLEQQGRPGEAILDTVRRYLGNNCRLEQTAKDLCVHANTVRYRLDRFEALTDCSLRSTDDLVAVWWALVRRRVVSDVPDDAATSRPDQPRP